MRWICRAAGVVLMMALTDVAAGEAFEERSVTVTEEGRQVAFRYRLLRPAATRASHCPPPAARSRPAGPHLNPEGGHQHLWLRCGAPTPMTPPMIAHPALWPRNPPNPMNPPTQWGSPPPQNPHPAPPPTTRHDQCSTQTTHEANDSLRIPKRRNGQKHLTINRTATS